MPELPEVETTLRGIKPHIILQKVTDVIVRCPHLRWAIPHNLRQILLGQCVKSVVRRGKYLLLAFESGTLIIHLGMSGRLQIMTKSVPAQKHDHVDIAFANQKSLRFTDPRRFGAFLWTTEEPNAHPLLKHIGPEPLSQEFTGEYLWRKSRRRTISVKSFIMDSKIVAGIGNIYAVEALFLAGIHPHTPAGKLSRLRYEKLTHTIKSVLKNAIKKGGTTLRDFIKPSGSPGYFRIQLNVYGKQGKPCPHCHAPLKALKTGQRSTVYCRHCQLK